MKKRQIPNWLSLMRVSLRSTVDRGKLIQNRKVLSARPRPKTMNRQGLEPETQRLLGFGSKILLAIGTRRLWTLSLPSLSHASSLTSLASLAPLAPFAVWVHNLRAPIAQFKIFEAKAMIAAFPASELCRFWTEAALNTLSILNVLCKLCELYAPEFQPCKMSKTPTGRLICPI